MSSEPPWKGFLFTCLKWCEDNPVPLGDLVFEGFEWAPVEHTIHELSHSVLLGLTLYTNLGELISKCITNLPLEEQIKNEKDAWAVEWLVSQKLGLPLAAGDILAGADVQGVLEEDMQTALDTPEKYEEYAEQVMESLSAWRANADAEYA